MDLLLIQMENAVENGNVYVIAEMFALLWVFIFLPAKLNHAAV